jgi:hypothetical protein
MKKLMFAMFAAIAAGAVLPKRTNPATSSTP